MNTSPHLMNASAFVVITFTVVMAFLVAGPAETSIDRLCSKHAPTTQACARW